MHILDPRDIPEGALVYAVVHRDHGLIDASPDLNAALASAAGVAAQTGGCYVLDSPPATPPQLSRVAANPVQAVRDAFAATGLPRLSRRDVMSWELDDALAEWNYLMPVEKPNKKAKGGKTKVRIWQGVDGVMGWSSRGRGLLRKNFKTEKDEGLASMTNVVGLSLLPASSMFTGYLGDDPRRTLPLSNKPKRGKTLCSYSTDECRAGCLTYSGQETNYVYNAEVKQATALALLNHPAPFMRILAASCQNHLECPGRYFPYIRMNVLSDIPWEACIPWLFHEFKGRLYKRGKIKGRHAFYDYTKIPGRNTTSNYDLTFSYASTDPTRHEMAMRELSRGLRCAVVFLLPGKSKHVRKKVPLPKSWLGFKVVDGDVHDVRPRDPQGVIVGLRYKSTYTVSEKELQAGALDKFVVRANPPVNVNVVRVRKVGGMLVADETPRQTGVVPQL